MNGIQAMVRQMLGAKQQVVKLTGPSGHGHFTARDRARAVRRYLAGERAEIVARDFGANSQTIRNWARAARAPKDKEQSC